MILKNPVSPALAATAIFVSLLVAVLPVRAVEPDIVLGTCAIVPDTEPEGVPRYLWSPDGHIAVVPDGGLYQLYWAGHYSYKTLGTDIMHMSDPGPAVMGPGPAGSYDNGGAWLMSVFRLDGPNMIGFFHAEDNEWPGYPNPGYIAWNSTALCTSADNGDTWTKTGRILTADKPAEPTWGNTGQPCVVWDEANIRWVCFFNGYQIYGAVSYNPAAAVGTWYKYYHGSFSEPGLRGRVDCLPGLENHPGGCPSVIYNTYLEKWIMVWHSWDRHLFTATSNDLVHWQNAGVFIAAGADDKYAYPTLLGLTDKSMGKDGWLCYAYWPDKDSWQRQFTRCRIRFQPSDINGDRHTDLKDYARLAAAWGTGEASADIVPADGDGVVDYDDLAYLCSHWLEIVD